MTLKAFVVIFSFFLLTLCVFADIELFPIRLIDHNPKLNRWLFRGNEPIIESNSKTQFAYNQLLNYLSTVAKNNNLTLPNNPEDIFVIDISFLIDLFENEKPIIELERNFFEKNKQLGLFLNWPLLGTFVNATELPEDLRKKWALKKDWNFMDQVIERVSQLNDWVWKRESIYNFIYNLNPSQLEKLKILFDKKHVVIYIHCHAGRDRTGELSGAYYLNYFNWTYENTLKYNYHVNNPPQEMHWVMQNELDWYCWYLYYTRGSPKDCYKQYVL
ncbi:hypothetical protein ABK040_004119 [Willaertia magna]